MADNQTYPVPPYDEFIGELQAIPDYEHRNTLAMLYAIGGRINEFPKSFLMKKREDGKKILIIKASVLKNPKRKMKTIHINMKKETDLVDMVRDFKEQWKKYNRPTEFWYQDRTIRNWYYDSLRKVWPGTSPHFLRHCRVTHVSENWDRLGFRKQLSIPQLKDYFGWARLESAATYFHLGEMDII